MALDTYANLKAEIADWLADDGLTNNIDTFIDLVEARMNRELRIGLLEKRATASTTAGDAYVGLPADMNRIRDIVIQGSPSYTLSQASPRDVGEDYHGSASGLPRWYFIKGTELRLAPKPDAAYTLEMIYYAKVNPLSDAITTNDILTSHPDLYLFGALAEAAPFLREDDRAALWEAKYQAGLAAALRADRMDRYSAAPMVERAQVVV